MRREILGELNRARVYLRDAEDEATNGATANARFIDQRVTQAREAVDRAILIAFTSRPEESPTPEATP